MADPQKLMDGSRTSKEWRESRTRICVLPIGAFEQHSTHLPLVTDSIVAEYFAAFLARELPAALLPVLSYGTSLENSGSPGTITLRPETLMHVIRDMADAVEEQGFETLIILTGHGGNYCVGPVVRDINRRDRRLKILFTDASGAAGSGFSGPKDAGLKDIHAGEFETSMMMALRPELVQGTGPDMKPAPTGFTQQDLNTFGMAYVAPEGAIGWPSRASKDTGEAMIVAAKKNLLAHIRQRLDWLANNRNYSGKGKGER